MICAAQSAPLAAIALRSYNSPVPTGSSTIRVKVLFFGRLKEIAGCAEDCFDLAEGASIEQLFAHYGARHAELAKYRSSVIASRNHEFAAWTTALCDADEVAFLPPVSGG
jgi:molybdopterin converting factor subunit 1